MNQTIPVEAIKAAALFCSKERTRYPMHCVELRHGELWATDGRRLARFTWEPAEGDEAPEKPVVIEAALMLQVAKVKGCHEVRVNGSMRALVSRFGRASASRYDGPEFPYQADEDHFPDCQQVVNQSAKNKPSDEPVRLNPDLLADIGKAAGIIQADSETPVATWTFRGKLNATQCEATGSRVSMLALLMPITS